MGIRVLGPVSVDEGLELGRRDRIVLSVLLLERPQPVSPERLEDILWPDGPPATSAKVIQGCVARLRVLLDQDGIVTTAHGYCFGRIADLDTAAFEAGVVRGRELLRLRQPDRAAHLLDETLALWRGQPFTDLEHWDVAAIETARLQELRLQAEELRVDALLASGRSADAAAAAATLVERDPLREPRWQQLALAQVRLGRQADALASLRRCRALLREELGLDPGAAIDELEQAILRGEPSLLDVDREQEAREDCPWPGLQSYERDRADTFFGRDGETVSALALLRGRGVLVVVGPSGVGKSSFVLAGVVPALEREGRRVTVVTPGLEPRLPGRYNVLVVDQCEEVFSLDVEAAARDAFFKDLVEQGRRGLLVVCLRADRMPDVADHPDLSRLVERGLFLLGPLGPAGLRSAVEEPAARFGWHVEPGLVDLLLRDLEGEPGALPLLSHALVVTWERREGRTLTVAGYQASGGVRGAVSQTAEELYTRLGNDQQATLRRLMLRLVSSGPEGERLRARVPQQLVSRDPMNAALVDRLIGSRLLTSDEGMVTLAHEALVLAWPRLRGWLEEDEERHRTLQHLAGAAAAWAALGRPDSELYRGVRLARVVELEAEMAPVEREFIEASAGWEESEAMAANERARTLARANRWLRGLLAGLAALLVAALVAGMLAVNQSRRAEQASVSADARRVGAGALVDTDIARSLLLASAAARVDPSDDTLRNLTAALARYPQLMRVTNLPTDGDLSRVMSVGSGVAVTDKSRRVTLLSSDLRPGLTYRPGAGQYARWDAEMVESPRAGVLAVAGKPMSEQPIRLLDPSTLTEVPGRLHGFPRRRVDIAGLAVGGRFLAATMATAHIDSDVSGFIDSGQVLVWDLMAPGRPVVLRVPIEKNWYNGVALSRDGRRLYVTNPLTAYSVSDGRQLWQQDGGDFSTLIDLDASGRRLAIVDAEQATDVALVDSRTGRQSATLRGHEGRLTWIEFSHEGSLVAASALDGLVMVWDAASGEVADRIEVGNRRVTSLGFSADDKTLYTTAGSEVASWDLEGQRSFLQRLPIAEPAGIPGGMVRPAYQHDEAAFTGYGSNGIETRLVTPEGTTRLDVLGGGWFGAMDYGRNDTLFAQGYDEGRVQVFDTETGEELARSSPLKTMVTDLRFSGDGRYLVAVDDGGRLVSLDAKTLVPAGAPTTVPEKPYSVAVSFDGSRAFVAAGGVRWRPYWDVPINHFYLIDLASGEVMRQGSTGVRSASYVAYSPTDDRVAVSGENGDVALIDLDTDQPVRPPVVAHDGNVWGAAFNDSGTRVVTSSDGRDAALWDAATGALLATAALPSTEGVTVSGFRPDGSVLLTTFSGSFYRWDASLSNAVDAACRLAGRDLTEEEWAEAFPDQEWRQTCP